MRSVTKRPVAVALFSGTAVALLASSALTSHAGTVPVGPGTAGTDLSDGRCAALAGLQFDQVKIESAQALAAGVPVAGTILPGTKSYFDVGGVVSGLPAFCRVIGQIRPEAGSDIRFEVWMPLSGWDGRLHGVGNGGFGGFITYYQLASAVRADQVGVSTDTGHVLAPAEQLWAKGHPERIRDYGWRAIHLSTVAAKKLVTEFYGRGPDHSYFISCSNGGRQALMEASRFPEDYDGVLAGAPAAIFSDVAMSMIWTVQAQEAPGAAIRPEQTELLQAEVLRQCDSKDGRKDGIVADPRQCKFETAKLACGVSSSPQCFTPPQITALNEIYAGPHDVSGIQVAPAYPPSGSEVGTPMPDFGWNRWIFGTPANPPYQVLFPKELLGSFVTEPFSDISHFDFNKDPDRFKAAIAADLDVKPDFRRFFARGGKLILWNGWADPAVSPFATIAFHDAIIRTSGLEATKSMRLFMVPGAQHCLGGRGASLFGQQWAPSAGDNPRNNMASALQAWVEAGHAPDEIAAEVEPDIASLLVGKSSGHDKQRLLCSYPAKAVLRGGADPDKASSYICRPSQQGTAPAR